MTLNPRDLRKIELAQSGLLGLGDGTYLNARHIHSSRFNPYPHMDVLDKYGRKVDHKKIGM